MSDNEEVGKKRPHKDSDDESDDSNDSWVGPKRDEIGSKEEQQSDSNSQPANEPDDPSIALKKKKSDFCINSFCIFRQNSNP